MFVGHYAAAMGARALKPAVPLWLLFVSVQFVDYVWSVLVILGIERVQIIPGYTAASPLRLYHMPYTHSLVGALAWAAIIGCAYYVISRHPQKAVGALIVAGASFSHWLTDLIVHVPDLPLFYGDPKFGFGLWRYFWPSQVVELGLLAVGTLLYVLSTQPKGFVGRFTPWLLLILLGAIQAVSHIPPETPLTPTAFAVQALAAYSVIALMAFGVDRTRAPKPVQARGETIAAPS